MFKTIHGTLPWSARTEWKWPAIDGNRLDRCFRDGPNDVDDAVPHILELCGQRRTCVQAGGAMGVWPIRLSQLFDRVITFEAQPENYACLLANTEDIENIDCWHSALGSDRFESVRMELDEGESRNPGAYFMQEGGDIPVTQLDWFELDDLDLLYLDIEGAETDALLGAEETIRRCRPVIGLEDKIRHAHRYGFRESPVSLLEKWGYTEHARYHLDVILKS